MAAKRYPADYNGIIAGAPAGHFQIQYSVFHGWSVVSNTTTGNSSGNAILYADKVAVLHKAVHEGCFPGSAEIAAHQESMPIYSLRTYTSLYMRRSPWLPQLAGLAASPRGLVERPRTAWAGAHPAKGFFHFDAAAVNKP